MILYTHALNAATKRFWLGAAVPNDSIAIIQQPRKKKGKKIAVCSIWITLNFRGIF
jgi:hypothetical protein